MKSNDWRHKNVARYTPGNTKILYFFNCLLDGMHTIISLDKISDEELLKEIHDYQKKCGKAGMIIYDSKKEDKRQCFDGDKTV